MAVIHALVLIQVGGFADGAAGAAPSPSRCALGRRSQAHVSKQSDGRTENQTNDESAASPLTRLAIAARSFRRCSS